MYSVYISDYLMNGSYVSGPTVVYDTKSPAKDMVMIDPVVDLEDSKAGSFSFTVPLNHYLLYLYARKNNRYIPFPDKYFQTFTLYPLDKELP